METLGIACRRLAFTTKASGRRISTQKALATRYDPRVFRDPIIKLDELNKKLAPEDEKNFLYIKAMESDDTPVFYRNEVVDKLVRVCMKDGGKETSRNNIFSALEIIKRRQYKLWREAPTEEEKAKIETNPFKVAEKGIKNCHPLMKLMPVTRGGTTYRVPFPIEEKEAEFRAMKMMRDICRGKAKHSKILHFGDYIANELLAAYNNEGQTIQAKQELHKQCEANRAYAHYRG
ncbi:unnamed protein product, partial [Mesorhabditis belari]|uniref:Small ribosomal subunit protein uS7m n=1 Tax=Mesorhabditis belari TaxID=2138241 RepID=A0AAF3FHQ1_9BILA